MMIWRCDLLPQYEAYKDEIQEAITRVLESGRYVLANEVAQFEKEFSDYVGVDYGVSVANATDALTLSLMALGIAHGDEVITTPYTAIPTVSAIIASGATPIFVDICEDTYLMDLKKVATAITPKTKAIMPVHIFGNVMDVEKLKKIVGNDIYIVEDASQAHGATIRGKQAGSMGDIGVFSFYPTKNLGAYGDGGIAVTQNKNLDAQLRLLRMYGMTDKDHIKINGINSRLDEMQASILRVKLKHLDKMNQSRRDIAQRYQEELPTELFKHQVIDEGVESNYHVFNSAFLGDRDAFVRYMDEHDIQTNIYYLMPLHLQEATRYLGGKVGDCPVAESLCKQAIALTFYPELKKDILDQVIKTVNQFVNL